MSEYTPVLIAIGVIIIAVLVGFLIGKYVALLKNQSEISSLSEKLNQSQLVLEETKRANESQLEFIHKQQETVLQQKEKQISELVQERETIRTEKDFLKNELTRRNTEFENLHAINKNKRRNRNNAVTETSIYY